MADQAHTRQHMNFDEFIRWQETVEGKWELHDGIPVRKHDPAIGQAERMGHTRKKLEIYRLLDEAIKKSRMKCEAITDGVTIQISDDKSFVPDASVYCGDRINGDSLVCPNSVIVVEVLSPVTKGNDHGMKLQGYFSLPSIQHYLIIDPDQTEGSAMIIHHQRGEGDAIITRIISDQTLALDPPGLEVDLSELLD